MKTYKLVNVTDYLGNDKTVISAPHGDGSISWIPADKSNTDYQAYLAWVDEGNVAEAAD